MTCTPIAGALAGARGVSLLLVSSYPEDHRYFQHFCDVRDWRLRHAWNPAGAAQLLRTHAIPVIVLEHPFPTEAWPAEFRAGRPDSPRLIAAAGEPALSSSRRAGKDPASDIVPRPLQDGHVFRAVTLAWLDWQLRVRLGRRLAWNPAPSRC